MHFNRVRHHMLTTYREPTNRLMEELAFLRDEFREDEAAQVLKQDINSLIATILYDEQVRSYSISASYMIYRSTLV
jgi:hypothetical protein